MYPVWASVYPPRWLAQTNTLGQPLRRLRIKPMPQAEDQVSCLMVTRGNLARVEASIALFHQQTYPQKELVVVCDDIKPGLVEGVARGGALVRLVPAPKGLSLGALRNLSIAAAKGKIICQWDDDDLYGPDRLAVGVAALNASGASAIFLRQWMVWAQREGLIGLSNERLWEGSMLALKKDLPDYPSLARGEDTHLVEALMAEQTIALVDDPLSYCYCLHGANTFGEAHMVDIVNNMKLRMNEAARDIGQLAPPLTKQQRRRLARHLVWNNILRALEFFLHRLHALATGHSKPV